MDSLIQDLRDGIRQLFRQRGSSLVAVLTLALGIGASTAIFSVVDATMLRPLPYPDPEQLVTVVPEEVLPDGRVSSPTPSMEDMRAWQAAGDVVSAVAGWGRAFRGRIVEGPEPERIQVLRFTEDYLSMHGVKLLMGRDFTRADTDPGSPLVALLGYGYWQRTYGGRDNVLGKTIRLDTEVATVVGVLPSWFNAATPLSIPLQIPADEFPRRGTGRVSVYARLRPDVTIDQARERLSARIAGRTLSDGSGDSSRRRIEVGIGRFELPHDGEYPRGSGGPHPAHRVRERRRLAAGARRRAAVRVSRARRAGRRARAADTATAHGKRRARDSRRRDCGVPRVALSRRDRREPSPVAAVQLAHHVEPHRAGRDGGVARAHGVALRVRAGDSPVARPSRIRPRPWRTPAWVVALETRQPRADRGGGRAGRHPGRGSRLDDSQLHAHLGRRSRLQPEWPGDDGGVAARSEPGCAQAVPSRRCCSRFGQSLAWRRRGLWTIFHLGAAPASPASRWPASRRAPPSFG